MTDSLDTLAREIIATWRELRGEHLLPRFLARRDSARVARNYRVLRALYSIAGPDRFDLGEQLVMSGGVHIGGRACPRCVLADILDKAAG